MHAAALALVCLVCLGDGRRSQCSTLSTSVSPAEKSEVPSPLEVLATFLRAFNLPVSGRQGVVRQPDNDCVRGQPACVMRLHECSRRTLLTSSLSVVVAAPLVAATLTAEAQAAAATPAAVAASAAGDAGGASATTEFVSGLIAGATQKTIKEFVLHPFDTVKTRLQVAGGRRSLFELALYDDIYSGIWPAVLSGAPAASLFIAIKDAVKFQSTKQLGGTFGNILAVACANVPYWLVRNPTEVIKSRRQVGQVEDATAASSKLWQEQGLSGFYRGYASNLAYAFPVDATKFVIFDAIKDQVKAQTGRKKLSPVESAVFGAVSSSIAQGVSTPLDVARTKIMTAPPEERAANVLPVLADVAANEGIKGLYAGITPKLVRAVVSGALQFSVLEGVKDVVNDALLGALAPQSTDTTLDNAARGR